MSQIEVADAPRFAKTKARLAHRKQQAEGFLKAFEWTWTKAVVFSLVLTFFILIFTSVIPSFWLYFADQKLKWSGAGPHGFWLKELRDAIAMGLATVPIIVHPGRRGDHAELAPEAPRAGGRRAPHGRIPVGAAMAFTKTEVDIHEDYVVEAVDPAWLAEGVKSPKHLMLDPDNCILCRACEDVCPGTAST